MKMKRLIVAIALATVSLVCTLGLPTLAQMRPAAPAMSQMSVDRQFMMTAAEAGLANIAMGQAALQKSKSTQVRQFAQAEINEQQQVKQDLMRLAPQMGVQLPTAPGSKYQALLMNLSRLSGEQFDQAFMNEGGVNAHLENAATFQREPQFRQNAAVVAVANKGLPIIKQHFTTASTFTNYQFAQIAQRFNNMSGSVPSSRSNQPTMPTVTPQ